MSTRVCLVLCVCSFAVGLAQAASSGRSPNEARAEGRMPPLIERFAANSRSLGRSYPVGISPARIARFEKFYTDTRAQLDTIDFDAMPVELLRADLENLKLVRDFKASWKFYGENPAHR